jgi:hypothetical protein
LENSKIGGVGRVREEEGIGEEGYFTRCLTMKEFVPITITCEAKCSIFISTHKVASLSTFEAMRRR